MALALGAALTAGAGGAAAQPGTEPIRITFSAVAGCPDGAAFTGELQARTARARLAAGGEAARTLRADVSAGPGGFRGRLAIEQPASAQGSSATAMREVSGASCGEVVSALALIAALAIDPEASIAVKPQPAPVTPAAPAPPVVLVVPVPTPPAPAPSPWWPPGQLPRTPESVREVPALSLWPPEPLPAYLPPYPGAEAGWRFGAGVHAAAVFGVAPSASPGALVFVDVGRAGADLLSPAFRLGIGFAPSSTVETRAGTASLRWVVGRLEGCPIRLDAAPLALLPCLTFEAGMLEGSGRATSRSLTAARPWAAAGLLGRTQLEVAGWLVLEGQGGVSVPFVRDTFVLEPDTTVHAVPAVAGLVSGGALVRF